MIDVVLGHLVAAANPRDMKYRGDGAAYRRDRRKLGMLLGRLRIKQPFPFDTLETAVAAAKTKASGTGSYAIRKAYLTELAEPARRALEEVRNEDDLAAADSASMRSFTDKTGTVWRYDETDIVGEGGAGFVYRGLAADGAAIAVKRVDLGSGGELARRIHSRELEIGELVAGGSSRVHLMVNLGVSLDEGSVFIAMPLAEESLKMHLARNANGLPISEVVSIVREIALGLQELTEIGVVHRDLKPANVLRVASKWQLADFGISRSLAESTAQWTRKAEGTAEYMAPERIEKGATTIRSDLYALGVIAFELLTGRPPFTGDDVLEIHRQHLEDKPPPLPDTVSDLMQRLVHRLLAKDPAGRHVDARAVVAALDNLDMPLTAWQEKLATAALNAQLAKEANRQTVAHEQRKLRLIGERRRLAVADLDDLIEEALVRAKVVLGDEVSLERIADDDVAYMWILSWGEYALVANAEINAKGEFNESGAGYPLLVGVLSGAKRDSRVPRPAVTADRLAANLIYLTEGEGGRWIKRIWTIPFLEQAGGRTVTSSLWDDLAKIEIEPILKEGFSDFPLSVETLIEPFLDLLNESAK